MTLRLPLTPYAVLDGFLTDEDRARLWKWTLAHRDAFEPSTLQNNHLDEAKRVSATIVQKAFEDWPGLFAAKVGERLDEILAQTGTSRFPVEKYEVSLVAHGDGAHFTQHTDIPIGPGRRPLGGDESGQKDRLLSAVYYFYRQPKGFTGGELRIHRFGSESALGDYADVEPMNNRLVVFPSWVPHEVRRVRVPSGQFEDQRFAVNCWLCARMGAGRDDDSSAGLIG